MVHEILARFAHFGRPIYDSGRWLSESRDHPFIICKLVESNDGMDGWCPKLNLKNRTNSRDRRSAGGERSGACGAKRSWAQRATRLWADREAPQELASERPRFGYRRLYIFLRREKTEEGRLHARERDLKQAEDFCIVLNGAGNCPRAGATLCSKPCRVAWFSPRARGVAGLACYVAADGTRIWS
jgi:hypothetical protein